MMSSQGDNTMRQNEDQILHFLVQKEWMLLLLWFLFTADLKRLMREIRFHRVKAKVFLMRLLIKYLRAAALIITALFIIFVLWPSSKSSRHLSVSGRSVGTFIFLVKTVLFYKSSWQEIMLSFSREIQPPCSTDRKHRQTDTRCSANTERMTWSCDQPQSFHQVSS